MPLPERVQKNAAKAAAIIAAAAAEKAGAPAAKPATPEAPPVAPIPPQPAAGDEVVALKAQLEQRNRDLAAANQRASVLKGKYEKELPAERAARVAAEARVKETEAQLARKVEAGDLNSLTEDDKKLLGADMLKVITKAAREVAAHEADSRVRPLAARFDGFERMGDEHYNTLIDIELPDFNAQNDDPKFIAWLQGADPATGQVRHDLLHMAHNGRQGHRTIEIFNAFREQREIGARQPNPIIPPGAEAHLAPDRGNNAPPPAPEEPEGKTITRASINAFYSEKRKGLWKGREAEARKFEEDISQALKDKRVR